MKKLTLGIALVAIVIAVGAFLGNSQVQPTQGSVTGPEVYSPYLSVNGYTEWFNKPKMFTATTSVCTIKSPKAATSTLVYFSARVGTATSSATTWTFAKNSDGSNATTTLISTISLGSGAQGTLVASTTPGTSPAVDSALVFGPNDYAVVAVAGVIYNAIPSANFGGVCAAKFVQN